MRSDTRSTAQVFRGLMVATMLATTVAWWVPPEVQACRGTPRPPMWGRTTTLGKTSRAVFPLAGAAVPIVVPFVVSVGIAATGPAGPPCTPVSTTVTLNLTCMPPPPPPGNPAAGPTVFATPAAGSYSFTLMMTIPPGGVRMCTVVGAATTLWADGSTTTGTGDVEICVVDPAPGQLPDPNSDPRLDLELLTPEIQVAHPGDQREHVYRLANNDPDESVTVTITADSEQYARLPVASAEPPGSGSGPYAIADPGTGDHFPIDFSEQLLPAPAAGNNYSVDDGTQELPIGSDPDKGGLIWLNQFTAQRGQEVIDKVSVVYGLGADGRQVGVLLYDDPDNDGDPSNATLLTRAEAVGANANTDIFNEVVIEPTYVGPAGSSFFVGVVMQESLGSFPAAQDSSSAAGVSWFAEETECNANVTNLSANLVPVQPISAAGFPGNWLIRAHGRSDLPPLNWVELPPDPTAFPIPVIAKSLTLCPGESRLVKIATRAAPMCPPGSGCEQRLHVGGTFSDGSPALACAAAVMLAETTVPPDFMCPDGGATAVVDLQPPSGLQFFANMPTHQVHHGAQVPKWVIQPEVGPPLVPLQSQAGVLEPNLGRISLPNVGGPNDCCFEHATPGCVDAQCAQLVCGLDSFCCKNQWDAICAANAQVLCPACNNGGPEQVAVFVDQFFDVVFEMQMVSKNPRVTGSLIHLVPMLPPPGLGDTYFFLEARQQLFGPDIPPELDTMFDLFAHVSVDGITAVGPVELHHPAQIIMESITLQIVGPDLLQASFTAVFPNDPSLPPQIERVVVNVDPGAIAVGLIPPPPMVPCPADLNGDGLVNAADLAQLLGTWGPTTEDPADLNHDGQVNAADLAQLLGAWGPC